MIWKTTSSRFHGHRSRNSSHFCSRYSKSFAGAATHWACYAFANFSSTVAWQRSGSPSFGMSFRFDRGDRRGDVEGKRANCEVYARIAQVQAEANRRFRCGLRGPAWESDPQPHFRWCRYVPRRKVAEEQRTRSDELQRCFDKLGDFDDDRWSR